MSKDLIGTVIDFAHQGEFRIVDFVHGHYYLVREKDGFDKMERQKVVDELLEDKRKADQLGDAYGSLFREKGAFHWGNHGRFAIDGVMGSAFGGKHKGCMTDTVDVLCSYDRYAGLLKIGSGGRSYSSHVEIRQDPSKPCGITVLDRNGREEDDMRLDDQEWFPIASLLDRMMIQIEEKLDEVVPIKGLQLSVSNEPNGTFFWQAKGAKLAYWLSPAITDEKRERIHWELHVGAVTSLPKGKRRGRAVSGDHRDREAWSFSSPSESISGDKVREMILGQCKQALREVAHRRKIVMDTYEDGRPIQPNTLD